MTIGIVKWFCNEKGYGFVSLLDEMDKEVFIHYSDIVGEGYKTLQKGQVAEFDMVDSPKGMKAISIKLDINEVTLKQHADKLVKIMAALRVDIKGRNTKQDVECN